VAFLLAARVQLQQFAPLVSRLFGDLVGRT
jgi:hypothetical protein